MVGQSRFELNEAVGRLASPRMDEAPDFSRCKEVGLTDFMVSLLRSCLSLW
jgi:hypothetical protein